MGVYIKSSRLINMPKALSLLGEIVELVLESILGWLIGGAVAGIVALFAALVISRIRNK